MVLRGAGKYTHVYACIYDTAACFALVESWTYGGQQPVPLTTRPRLPRTNRKNRRAFLPRDRFVLKTGAALRCDGLTHSCTPSAEISKYFNSNLDQLHITWWKVYSRIFEERQEHMAASVRSRHKANYVITPDTSRRKGTRCLVVRSLSNAPPSHHLAPLQSPLNIEERSNTVVAIKSVYMVTCAYMVTGATDWRRKFIKYVSINSLKTGKP